MPLPIAIDYRPALLSRAGIGRATRELVRALDPIAGNDDLALHLFGHSLARVRVPQPAHTNARLHRLPIPGRSLPLLRRLGCGADDLSGSARVFHWTDYVQPPVRRARVVLTVHDLAFARDASFHGDNAAVLLQQTRRAIAAADALVVPSQTTADDLRRYVPTAPTPHVIGFGSDHVPTTTAPDPLHGQPFALAVGTIEPRKNHLALLAAWRRLKTPRPLLVVAGQVGWDCDAIIAELERAERDGLVRYCRQLDDRDLWPLLQHAQLLLYPSLWEGFGFPPLEAMALGVPVVAHDCAPLRELGDGALTLTDARDPDALAEAIAQLLHDQHSRQRAAAAGRTRAAAFTWRACATRHAALYRELAGGAA